MDASKKTEARSCCCDISTSRLRLPSFGLHFCDMANIPHKPSRYMLNLQHVLSPFANEEKNIVNGLIEINAGTINKYEFITESGQLKLDRVGYSSLAYPVAYGLIPQTWDQDNDMLDIVIANVT